MAALTEEALYARLAPASAYIRTLAGSGSGILLDNHYVVTNAHVVWPFDKVRVVLPDGSEFPAAPVVGWDRMADLAVIGPLNTDVQGLTLADGEALPAGTQVYLIGYPLANEDFPQPAMTGGMISRLREWAPARTTYFQSDAAIDGGQSGGMLVTQDGRVIGISCMSWGQFSLVASASDQWPRIEGLIAGEKVNEVGARRWPALRPHQPVKASGEPAFKQHVRLENPWDTRTYILDEPPYAEAKIEVESENDYRLMVTDLYGRPVCYANAGETGLETCAFTILAEQPHLLIVWQNSFGAGAAELRSNHVLTPLEDVDDGKAIAVGQPVQAVMDYPGDVDYFALDLEEGQTVDVHVDSLNMDPMLKVTFRGASEAEEAHAIKSKEGVWENSANLIYRAPVDGRYFLVVEPSDFEEVHAGGYFVEVVDAKSDDVPVPINSPTPAPTMAPRVVLEAAGPMAMYYGRSGPFAFRYPAGWSQEITPPGATAFFHSEDGGSLVVQEEDLWQTGWSNQTLDWYIQDNLDSLANFTDRFALIRAYYVRTGGGAPAAIIEYTGSGGQLVGERLVGLHQGRYGFAATYAAPAARFKQLKPMVDYSFSTFEIMGDDTP